MKRNEMVNEGANLEELMVKVDDAVIAAFTSTANEEFTGKELKQICKAGLTKDEVISLSCFYNMKMKQHWANSLIVKSFLLYRENTDEIMALEDWLFHEKICSKDHRFNMRDLNDLVENMQTPEDYDIFVDICEECLGRYGLNYILVEFLRAKKEPQIA